MNRRHQRDASMNHLDWEQEERGQGRRRGRFFQSGNLKIVVLHLLLQRASHGYELMKEIGEMVGGDYAPSPGVIYPILTLLEDLGYATVANDEGNRKLYQITATGKTFLEENQPILERILLKLKLKNDSLQAQRPPELVRAMHNLKMALHMKVNADNLDKEQIHQIAALLDGVTVAIERL